MKNKQTHFARSKTKKNCRDENEKDIKLHGRKMYLSFSFIYIYI